MFSPPSSSPPPPNHVQQSEGVEGREEEGVPGNDFCHPVFSLYSRHLTEWPEACRLRPRPPLAPQPPVPSPHFDLPHICSLCLSETLGCIVLTQFILLWPGWGVPGNALASEVLYFSFAPSEIFPSGGFLSGLVIQFVCCCPCRWSSEHILPAVVPPALSSGRGTRVEVSSDGDWLL